jgi:hypothetical protein
MQHISECSKLKRCHILTVNTSINEALSHHTMGNY